MSNPSEALTKVDLKLHCQREVASDKIAYDIVKVLRFFANKFFVKRYGNRAVVLETVAAAPGIAGGLLMHLKVLRSIKDD